MGMWSWLKKPVSVWYESARMRAILVGVRNIE